MDELQRINGSDEIRVVNEMMNPDQAGIYGGRRNKGMIRTDMPGRPLVSIVTVALNEEEYIRKTIESVLQQTYEPIEYIVIDGGSTDNTVSILREYDDAIDYWYSGPDKGISDAFNMGIRNAEGKYIGLMNAGDWYELDAVAKIVEAFSRSPEPGVVCGALQFWDGDRKEYVCESVPRLLEKDMTVTHPTCFVRTDLYDRFGLYEDEYKYAMDYKLLLRLKVNGIDFVALPSVLANMRHAGISEMRWQDALAETHRARADLLPGSFFASTMYYSFVLLKRQIRIWLQKLGLTHVISFYRSRLALVKKKKA